MAYRTVGGAYFPAALLFGFFFAFRLFMKLEPNAREKATPQ
jgi:hypothetical protein